MLQNINLTSRLIRNLSSLAINEVLIRTCAIPNQGLFCVLADSVPVLISELASFFQGGTEMALWYGVTVYLPCFLFLIIIYIICTVGLLSDSGHLVRLGLIDSSEARIIFHLFGFFHHLLHLPLFCLNKLFDGTNILRRPCSLPCSHQGSPMCHYLFDHLVLRELFVVFGHGQRMILIGIDIYLNSITSVIYVI